VGNFLIYSVQRAPAASVIEVRGSEGAKMIRALHGAPHVPFGGVERARSASPRLASGYVLA